MIKYGLSPNFLRKYKSECSAPDKKKKSFLLLTKLNLLSCIAIPKKLFQGPTELMLRTKQVLSGTF